MPVTSPGFQGVPEVSQDSDLHRRQIAQCLNRVLAGKINVTIDATLTHDSATTTLTDARIGFTSAVIPAMALTSAGKDAVIAGIWVDNILSGSCRLNHRNNASTTQTIRFVIIN